MATHAPFFVIVPDQPDNIYVPVYDPTVAYVQCITVSIKRPLNTFGFCYQISPRFPYDCDWPRPHHLRGFAPTYEAQSASKLTAQQRSYRKLPPRL